MAVAYPLTMPDILTASQITFDPALNVEQAPTGGGQIARDLGAAYWSMSVTSNLKKQSDYQRLRAWIDLLEGGTQLFYAYDLRRPRPLAYAAGFGAITRADGTAFDGTVKLSAVAADNKSVTLATAPAGFIYSDGDYLSFTNGNFQALHRIVFGGSATADANGSAVVEVRPHVAPGWAANAVVNLVKASCTMSLVPGSYKPSESSFLGQIAFQAQQVYTS